MAKQVRRKEKREANTSPAMTPPESCRTVIACTEGIGRPGMDKSEYANAAWSFGTAHDVAATLSAAVMMVAEQYDATDPRLPQTKITIFSSEFEGLRESANQRATRMSFEYGLPPSIMAHLVKQIEWIPVPADISRAALANGVRSEISRMSGASFQWPPGSSTAHDDQSDDVSPSSRQTNWLFLLWPAESFGFTPNAAAEFLAESAFGIGVVLPVPLN